ncbi:MAG: hypothetical protein A2845_01615 [Candidatus Lloydbacteria bacterium RIFCSPHIGHO2_01_FULL_49_22]|uniref:Uncharacterized protein n=1 Tax=Candidatus Lloydbacteria bacterium RIFCSPHIGHO2_01_FULL_49_22 TaxID=1798658 RepID=A0A1G2CXM2_9BACT|nr:MAG: hypothetical protein A2845_01615 [Candidatus Lloydbacteria bacterium RIFCSPHIGHO2_01_FULL_49_22]OGZ09995.1 MAG: hypothetical protein A3C14_04780 [Candidatus Lloydbacteria bacterium RIFCSPHIGHO2_02_FULL_50_18]
MNIVERVKKLDLPAGEYVVVGSGILDALHIREAQDIDIAVVPALLARLRAKGGWEEEERYGKVFLKKGDIEIIPQLSWEDYPTTTEEAIDSAMIIEGVPFMNLAELCKFKKALGREKDQTDIALINAYKEAHAL